MLFDIIALAFIALFSFIMMKRGGVRAILSFCSLALSIIIASFLYSPITNLVYATSLPQTVEDMVEEVLIEQVEKSRENEETPRELPKFIGASIDMEEGLSGEDVTGALASQIAKIIISVMVFLVVVIITKIILAIIIAVLDLATKIPLVHQLNSALGLGFGVVISVVIVWIASVVVGVMAASDASVAGFIDGSVVINVMSNIMPF